MRSPLNEIYTLRNGKDIDLDRSNSNRYSIVTYESDGSKTAYCFSCPIYNFKSRRMINMRFSKETSEVHLSGSNADISISDVVRMENPNGRFIMDLNLQPSYFSERQLYCGNDIVLPSANGIAVKSYVKNTGKISFNVEAHVPILTVRANDKYFAFMCEKFTPFAAISCIGAVNDAGNVIAPAKMECERITDNKYHLTISSDSSFASYLFFEVNLHEAKLFQDTTVESGNPKTNNAFGTTAFVGDTAMFGEQWLYSRPDFMNISEFIDKRVRKFILHTPSHNVPAAELSVYKPVSRFCSFGSVWDNKIASGDYIDDMSNQNGYQSLDITEINVDTQTRMIKRSDGFIFKPKLKHCGFCSMSTGDSCYAPQILEINYK